MRERDRSINNTTDFLITPTMQAPLETSLVLRKGTGDPTWSRATKKWRFNELGLLRDVVSGAADFNGARYICNTVRTTSEDFSNAAWVKTDITITGTDTIVSASATSQQYITQSANAPTLTGQNFLYSVRVKSVTSGINFVQLTTQSTGFGTAQYANFSLSDGSFNATGCTAISSYLGDGTYEFSARFIATANSQGDAVVFALANSLSSGRIPNFIGDGVKSVQLLRAWACDVTGYPSSYVPEYVSVGAIASPWFGGGVTGVRYFTTDYTKSSALSNTKGINLEIAATNNILRSRRFSSPNTNDTLSGSAWLCSQTVGAELITNGGFDSDTVWAKGATWTIAAGIASCTSTTAGVISQELSGAGLVSGKTYVITWTITRSAGSIIVSLGSAANDTGAARNASGTYTETIVCGANTTLYFYAYGNFVGTLDDVSIKECASQVTLTTGLDGITSSATTLTATANDATILQARTIASSERCVSAYVKRRTGTGTISLTMNGGTNWTDITSLINSSTYTRVQITSTVTNPSIGFKISTSGDAIDVDCVQNEVGALATSPIVTTTATVTRNADSLTYQTSGNFSDTVGTAYVEVTPITYSGGAIGSATNGLLLSTSNSGATAFDGTNAANGPTGTPGSTEKLALNWTGTAMKVSSSGAVGTVGTYDGAMGLTNIGIGVGANGNFKNVAVYPYALSDSDMVKITT